MSDNLESPLEEGRTRGAEIDNSQRNGSARRVNREPLSPSCGSKRELCTRCCWPHSGLGAPRAPRGPRGRSPPDPVRSAIESEALINERGIERDEQHEG